MHYGLAASTFISASDISSQAIVLIAIDRHLVKDEERRAKGKRQKWRHEAGGARRWSTEPWVACAYNHWGCWAGHSEEHRCGQRRKHSGSVLS